jgi:AraC family transcriptional regulator
VENNIELRDEPVFEEYLNKDPRRTKPENLKTLIYLPIV